MKVDLEVVKSLAKNLNKYNLSELTFEGEGEKLTIKREVPQEKVVTQVVQQRVAHQSLEVEQLPVMEEKVAPVEEKVEAKETITSPMVGTYYGAAAPGAAPFVTVGQEVNEGDTLCIVEAMKLMNEVKATKKCSIEAILVKDGVVLKKGDSIFAIS